MGSNLQNRGVDPTQDELPLPPGFECREDRRVAFLNNNTSDGLKGLAWAVMLMAVADGCNPAWLEMIADYYQLDIDPALLYRQPVAKGMLKSEDGEFVRIDDLGAKISRSRSVHPLVKDIPVPAPALAAFIKRV